MFDFDVLIYLFFVGFLDLNMFVYGIKTCWNKNNMF